MKEFVYLLNLQGNPLMPTTRYGGRRALRDGKVKTVCTTLFTIKLTYELKTQTTQPIIDTRRVLLT